VLVLSCRLHQKIVLPSLHVAAIKPGAVRVAIEAPAHVPILREELLGRPRGQPEAAWDDDLLPKALCLKPG
jgi:sRNA-binding carbon storage regulator CsrA